jgi:NADH-quinone oxidoreductase subunit M
VAGIKVYTLLSAFGVVLAAGYILWMLQRVFFGPALEKFNGIKDADKLEMVYMFVLVGLIILVGVYPAILTDVINLGISPIVHLLGI